eukprot:11842756-Prorocentrum_lima.AAC.1
MSDEEPEQELTYVGRSGSFVGARGATYDFDENKVVKRAVESPLCACCKEYHRGPRFVAMMEKDPKDE